MFRMKWACVKWAERELVKWGHVFEKFTISKEPCVFYCIQTGSTSPLFWSLWEEWENWVRTKRVTEELCYTLLQWNLGQVNTHRNRSLIICGLSLTQTFFCNINKLNNGKIYTSLMISQGGLPNVFKRWESKKTAQKCFWIIG